MLVDAEDANRAMHCSLCTEAYSGHCTLLNASLSSLMVSNRDDLLLVDSLEPECAAWSLKDSKDSSGGLTLGLTGSRGPLP